MRTWVDLKMLEHCGYCGAELPTGTRAQRLVSIAIKRRRYRCMTCADGPVPAGELEPTEAPPRPIIRPDMTRIGEVDSPLTRDWKQKQVNEHA